MKKSLGIYERHRIRTGRYGSDASYGMNGAFILSYNGNPLKVIANDDADWEASGLPDPPWEHVSVSAQGRCPTWEEMCFVKSVFWGDDETVLQFHVPKDQHINNHPHVLHLWKPVGVEVPHPPPQTVGPQEAADE